MNEEQIGDIILRLLADEVSMGEVRKVLRHMRDSSAFRERASTIGSFVEAEEDVRTECCSNMIDVLLHWVTPSHQEKPTLIVADARWYVRMGNKALGKILKPLPQDNPWHVHVKRTGKKLYTNQKNECYVSQELYDIIMAIEDLWGVQKNYTVECREMTQQEYLRQVADQEAKTRGSKLVNG